MNSPLEEHKPLFERSLKTIAGVRVLFTEAGELFSHSEPNFTALQEQLENPFSIFVCGEFNSGKSSLLNKLGEEKLAQVGILPTTSSLEAYYPEGFGGLVFIDSPGTNSIVEEHQEQTENYLQRADIILFVTSIERPLTKSEQDFLGLVNNTWVRQAIVAINKVDLAESEELEQVVSYVQEGLQVVFSPVPPIFAVSARTGDGVNKLRDYLLELLVDKEKVKLKLQGPQRSLLVYLEKLEQKNQETRERLLAEKKVFDQTIRRIKERIEQYDLIFGVFEEKIGDTFNRLTQQLNQIIDSSLAFLTLIRQRLTREDDLLEQKIAKAIKDVQLDQAMDDILKEAAATLLKYRERIIREAKEDLQLAASISEDSFSIPSLETKKLDVSEISEKLKIASQKGFNNFLTFGTAAAATGIGGHVVATAALFDLSALILALMLTLFSLNAVPQQREKAKQQLEENIFELEKNYTEELRQGLQKELVASLEQFTDSLQPRINELESKIAASQNLEDKVLSWRQEIKEILQLAEQL
ncbi:MAG: dynamin family protein [Spirulinaceae cyanobacterium]